MLRGKFKALNVDSRKEQLKTSDLNFYPRTAFFLKKLEQEQTKCKEIRNFSKQKSMKMETGDHLPQLGHAVK